MFWEILIGCAIIVLARIGDVSLGTLRTVAVVNGHRGLAWLFGLLEVTIWVFVVSAVISRIQTEPLYGIAFALGAATGNYIGVTLQNWLPFGNQVVRVFTRQGMAMFERLRDEGYRVTRFAGEGRDGAVTMLFIQVGRARTRHVVRSAREQDPKCYYTVDDIRVANTSITRPLAAGVAHEPLAVADGLPAAVDRAEERVLETSAKRDGELKPEATGTTETARM